MNELNKECREQRKSWNGKPYCSLDYMLRERFGEKVYKVTLNGGMSCPNRDGTLGTRGCIFCSEGGSGDFAADVSLSVTEQIESQIAYSKIYCVFSGVYKHLCAGGIPEEDF